MRQSRLPAFCVRQAQLARAVHAQAAAPVLLPTPTAQCVIFAQQVDTVLLESRVKHVLTVSTRQAYRMDALPTTL